MEVNVRNTWKENNYVRLQGMFHVKVLFKSEINLMDCSPNAKHVAMRKKFKIYIQAKSQRGIFQQVQREGKDEENVVR